MIRDDTMMGKRRVMKRIYWSLLLASGGISAPLLMAINWIDVHNKTDGELLASIIFHHEQNPLWTETLNDPVISWPQEKIISPGGQYRFGARPRTLFGKPCIKKLYVKKVSGNYRGSSQEYVLPFKQTCMGDLIIDVVDSSKEGGILLQQKYDHGEPVIMQRDPDECHSCAIK